MPIAHLYHRVQGRRLSVPHHLFETSGARKTFQMSTVVDSVFVVKREEDEGGFGSSFFPLRVPQNTGN